MLAILRILILAIRSACRSRSDLVLENLALRQQVAVLQRGRPRPRLNDADRRFWIAMRRLWAGWRGSLAVVQPETVLAWHRKGFRAYWRRKCVPGPGRPRVSNELRALIRRMADENPLWGAPKVHSELLMLGIDVSEATVSRYFGRSTHRPRSQTWKTFLDNHIRDVVAVDFFAVPTATFRVLYVFVVLAHDRRKILHVNVADRPTGAWAGRQIIEAFPWGRGPKFLLRDGAGEFGKDYQRIVESLGIRDLVTSPGSPWQNGYVERVIGSIRRECTDHVIVLSERHLRRVLSRYAGYYNAHRPHRGLGKDSPLGREPELDSLAPIRAIPEVGGLHHRYTRKAA